MFVIESLMAHCASGNMELHFFLRLDPESGSNIRVHTLGLSRERSAGRVADVCFSLRRIDKVGEQLISHEKALRTESLSRLNGVER